MLDFLQQFIIIHCQIILIKIHILIILIINNGLHFVIKHQNLLLSFLSGFLAFFIIINIIPFIVFKIGQRQKLFGKQLLKKSVFLQKFYHFYQWANLPFSYNFFLGSFALLNITLFILSSLLTTIFNACLITFFIGVFCLISILIIAKRNKQKIARQLPFVLEILANTIQSGYSLSEAIKLTGQEVEMPLKLIFKQIIDQLQYNIPLEKVLTDTQKTIENQELKIILSELVIQNQMGGNMIKMLTKMASWVRQRNKLQKDIRTFTAQGRLSGLIIMMLWPISAIIFYFLNKDYITILFTNSFGQIFLIISFILEAIGFTMIWKIVKIKI
jgi:tight adherence protein B